jgi:diacylglycerol kinase (ATP)
MAKPGRAGLSRIVHAARYSWMGLRAAWCHEAAFRQELLLAAVLLPLSFWLAQSAVQLALLWLTLGLVLITELLNSAVEAVVDRIGSERHPLSGRAKDIGSAAVMLSLLLLAGVWIAIGVENWALL